MDVELPNGKVIQGVPEGTTKEQIKQKAIQSGLAKPEDFGPDQAPDVPAQGQEPVIDAGQPETQPPQVESERSMLGTVYDFFAGKEGERGIFSAPELNEISMRAFKSGLGGLLSGDPTELQQIIAKNYPEAEFVKNDKGDLAAVLPSGTYPLNPEGIDLADAARFGVDVAAFTPAGRVTGAGVGALAKGAAVAGGTQAGMQATEAAVGGTFDPSDVALEVATQGGFQVAGAIASPLVKKVRDRFRGSADTEAYDAVSSVLKKRKADELMPEIMADPEILKAANDLGINVNPGVYSTNRIYQEMENALRSIPESKLSANEKDAIEKLGERADSLIREFAGTTDKSTISDDVLTSIKSTIDTLGDEAEVVYKTINDVIPDTLKIQPKTTVEYIDGLIERYGSVEDLSPQIRQLYKRMKESPEGLNYALLDQRRKEVGSAAFKNEGIFKDASKNELKELYSTLTDDTMRAAGLFDLTDEAQIAKALVAKRKGMEQVAQKAFGKDLSKSVMAEMGSAVRALGKGQTKKFDEVISAVPEDMREQVAVSALNDILSGGSTKAKAFSLGGLVSSYEALQRNKKASAKLFDLVPEDARKRLDDIYKVSKGIVRLNQKDLNNPSGTARQVIGAMDGPDGLLAKLYRGGGRIAAGAAITSPVDSGVAGAAYGIGSALHAARTKATKAADEMLSSEGFSDAVKSYMNGNSKAANSTLRKIGGTASWIANQPAEVKRAIARQGLIQYLTTSDQEEQNDTNTNQ